MKPKAEPITKAKNSPPAGERTLPVPWPLLPGSITTARSTCGKAQCPCRTDPARRHGPYYRWTGVVAGKRTTKTLSAAEARECLLRIKRYKTLEKAVRKLVQEALREAPWNKR